MGSTPVAICAPLARGGGQTGKGHPKREGQAHYYAIPS